MQDSSDNIESLRSDNPIPLDFPLNKCNLTIRERCGQCLHFKRMAYPPYKKPCIDKGIIEESKPCKAFQADLSKIKFTEKRHVKNIASAMEELSPAQLRLMASILNGEERTRRYGFKFGEILYFRAFGGDYLSNYVKAKVLFADSKHVYLQGSDGCFASLYHGSVLKERAWMRKEAELVRDNKRKDPNLSKYTRVPTKKERDIKSILDKIVPSLTAETKINSTLSKADPVATRTMRLDQFAKILMVR